MRMLETEGIVINISRLSSICQNMASNVLGTSNTLPGSRWTQKAPLNIPSLLGQLICF
jgi:hypothetical protein